MAEGWSPRLRPHGAPVNPELACQRVHAHTLRAGCSHSAHFLVREPCSRSFTWFRRRADQRVIGSVLGIGADALIPCGNELLNPWSSVPATLHCVHRMWSQSREMSVVVASGRPKPPQLTSRGRFDAEPQQEPTRRVRKLVGRGGCDTNSWPWRPNDRPTPPQQDRRLSTAWILGKRSGKAVQSPPLIHPSSSP